VKGHPRQQRGGADPQGADAAATHDAGDRSHADEQSGTGHHVGDGDGHGQQYEAGDCQATDGTQATQKTGGVSHDGEAAPEVVAVRARHTHERIPGRTRRRWIPGPRYQHRAAIIVFTMSVVMTCIAGRPSSLVPSLDPPDDRVHA
jgi:hypothetical protein